MVSPVFTLLAGDAAVTALIGAPPAMRCYSGGMIPETPTINAALPCVTQQRIAGEPANNLARAPSIERVVIQINVWALTAVQAKQVMEAVRDALEAGGANCMGNVPSDTYEPETKRFGWMFDIHFWINR
jgi:hypothetical protein